MTTYTYSIHNDFPNHAISSDRLTSDIISSSIIIALDCINTSGDQCDIIFKTTLSDGDKLILDGLVAAHSGESLPSNIPMPVTIDIASDTEKRMRVSLEPRKEGDQVIIVSHNWCDPCTWYAQSVRITGEVLSGDGYSYTSQHTYWIDLTHGKLYREDLVSASYLVKIYVNGQQKTARLPFMISGGDYEVNYVTGIVTFFTNQSGCVITADYSYQNGSRFIVAPASGKKIWVEKTEVQFSSDVDLKDTAHFQAWAYNPYSPPQKVPVGSKTSYKTTRDYIDEANGVYPVVPAFGGSTRGL